MTCSCSTDQIPYKVLETNEVSFLRQQHGRRLLRPQNARQDAFLDLWLWSLAEERASPTSCLQSICDTSGYNRILKAGFADSLLFYCTDFT